MITVSEPEQMVTYDNCFWTWDYWLVSMNIMDQEEIVNYHTGSGSIIL